MMTPQERIVLASKLLSIDPSLGGMVLRTRAGPTYQRAMNIVTTLARHRITKLQPSLPIETLDGGIDVAASLANGKMIHAKGILEGPASTLILPMAERCDDVLINRLANQLETDAKDVLIAFDEGAEADETCDRAIKDRLAFHIDLTGVAFRDLPETVRLALPSASDHEIVATNDLLETIVHTCSSLGISSLRAGSFAIKTARAHARLLRKTAIDSEDLDAALQLVLAPRATQMPMEDPVPQPDETPESDGDSNEKQKDTKELPQDMLVEAIKAVLPPELLANLSSDTARASKGSGSGKKRVGNRRGRPLPARGTRAGSGARIDLMATLRAAVPYQKLRRHAQPTHVGPIFYPSDLRHKRYQDHSDRLLIFTVDASGSAAVARLAEAKGAVELLLAQAYARRDHVSLIAFRGNDATTLLPPTRSLVQTKRRLADLVGGGGTPLASGIRQANVEAQAAQRKGLTPTVILLTDGRANVALDQSPDRSQAAKDAVAMGLSTLQLGADAIVIDAGNRPEPSLRQLAQTMGGHYLSLPRANAQKLSESVQKSLAD